MLLQIDRYSKLQFRSGFLSDSLLSDNYSSGWSVLDIFLFCFQSRDFVFNSFYNFFIFDLFHHFFFMDFLKQYFTINILFSKDQDYGVLNFVMFCGGVYLRKVEKVLFRSDCMCNQAKKIVPPWTRWQAFFKAKNCVRPCVSANENVQRFSSSVDWFRKIKSAYCAIIHCDYGRYQITTVVQLSLRNNLVETSSGVAKQLRSQGFFP